MNTSSRFACLDPEIKLDDAFKSKTKKPRANNRPKDDDDFIVKISKNTVVKPAKKKKKPSDIRALAFGFGEKTNAPSNQCNETGKKNKDLTMKSTTDSVDDAWKERDNAYVKKENEEALRQAILQSKLEIEQEKKNAIKVKKEEEKENEKKETKGKKRKEKPIKLSLEEFNNLEPEQLSKGNRKELRMLNKNKKDEPAATVNDVKFFKDIEDSTRKMLDKEKRQEEYKNNFMQMNKEEQMKKIKSEMERKDFEIQALKFEVVDLKKKLDQVKERNSTLCSVIGKSEMNSKGELVVLLEKMTKHRDEFSEEVTLLNSQLEKERTKVSQLTMDLKKLQGKRRNADSIK